MKYIKLAGASLNQTPLSFRQNTRNILNAIEMARKERVQILCLPELAISAYGCEDAFFNKYVLDRSLEALEEIVEASEDMTLCVGLPMEYESCLYNVVAVIHDQEICGFVPKQNLPGDGIYYEPRWFKAWPEDIIVNYQWDENYYPFGDLIFEIDGIRIGLEICEDAWNGVRPAQRHYLNGVDIILNPSASNFAFGKTQTRQMLVSEASRGYNCTYVYSNLLGNEAGRIIYDGEILIAQSGNLLARNKRFSFDDYQILSAVVDVEKVRIHRRKSYNYRPEIPDNLVPILGEITGLAAQALQPILEDESKDEEFYLAETLALFDYMRKSYSRGFVLSLSGGADSSTCAVLCSQALIRARKELGEDKFREKLSYISFDEDRDLIPQLLTTVYQGTANSGTETLESARELSKGIGASFHHWDVEHVHQDYIQLAESAIGRKLSWEKDDITLQNIQARLRAPGIWMLANHHKALLITTSNRSEAAVGYATMDGDTSGGLAPLGGIDKDSLLEWLRWAEVKLEIKELSYVNSLKPTAELRPEDYDQTDEADLMPYDILDDIEKCAIRDYQSPLEVFLSLRGGKYKDLQLKGYIRKFFTLWSRNQWKRERYAPSFHLDDENLDPKTWCRFPILNGGFWEALEEMDDWREEVGNY
ncbi:MAG: NAD(+) synthase [Bacteroidia bacterium]|nr:NAD(+) synthase [Bacteroidia bacterium]